MGSTGQWTQDEMYESGGTKRSKTSLVTLRKRKQYAQLAWKWPKSPRPCSSMRQKVRRHDIPVGTYSCGSVVGEGGGEGWTYPGARACSAGVQQRGGHKRASERTCLDTTQSFAVSCRSHSW